MKKIKLSQTEIIAVCKATENVVVDLGVPNWSYNMLTGIQNALAEQKTEGIDLSVLYEYFVTSSDIKLLELLMTIDEYWEREDAYYKTLGLISPKEKLIEIKTRNKLSKKPLKMTLNQMDLIEFFMISQSMGNKYIISFVDYNDESYFDENLIGWSVSKDNIGKLLKRLSSKERPIQIFKLKEVKRRVIN